MPFFSFAAFVSLLWLLVLGVVVRFALLYAYILGWQIAAYYAHRYQIVFGVHENTENLHIHFVFNTVSFVDGLKYNNMDKLNAYVNKTYNEYTENVQYRM